MNKEKKIKLFLGSGYLLIVLVFLWIFFNNFSIQDFSSYELIKDNRDTLEQLKNRNIFISCVIFFFGTIIWSLLLGFGSPILLISGFIFGKWLGTLLAAFGLTIGASLLYIFANYFLKDIVNKKFSSKFKNLTYKFKKNEFIFFLIYRFVGGIPFFISNIIPVIFNVKINNFIIGSLIGMYPQIFVWTALGEGLNKIIEKNFEAPSIYEILFSSEIYTPIIGFMILLVIGIIIKNIFYKQ